MDNILQKGLDSMPAVPTATDMAGAEAEAAEQTDKPDQPEWLAELNNVLDGFQETLTVSMSPKEEIGNLIQSLRTLQKKYQPKKMGNDEESPFGNISPSVL